MKVVICLLVFLPLTAVLHAQKKTITAAKAKNYIGKTVTVLDKIHEARLKNVSKDEMDVLYTGNSDYEHRTMAFVFPKDVLKRFSYNPNEKMINHTFYATGKIIRYEGKPAMYIRDENQLNVSE